MVGCHFNLHNPPFRGWLVLARKSGWKQPYACNLQWVRPAVETAPHSLATPLADPGTFANSYEVHRAETLFKICVRLSVSLGEAENSEAPLTKYLTCRRVLLCSWEASHESVTTKQSKRQTETARQSAGIQMCCSHLPQGSPPSRNVAASFQPRDHVD